MFSTREKRSSISTGRARRNRNLKAMVQMTHDALMPESATAPLQSQRSVEEAGNTWDEMVFAGRNKSYGAFLLRGDYHQNIAIGLAVTMVAVMFILLSPALSAYFMGGERAPGLPPKKLVYTELSAPPPIHKPRPLPPQVQLPRLQRVLKFVPPKVVAEEIAEVVPTIEEIKENETGAVAVEGPAEVIFDEPVAEIVVADDELFTVVDQQPEFEGGYEAMMAFIKQNMIYPANARRMKIEGTVHVSFIVSKTGSISEVKVLRGFMTECDREAVRVVQLMPAWTPGKQNGRNVNVRFILPLKFRLN
jgi:periplasmic protein TonB